jgi:hypothetical protein
VFDNMEIYIQADPLFYEDPRRWVQGPPFLKTHGFSVSERRVPDGWSRRDHGLWTHVSPDGVVLPEQGWKIHVSATLDNGDALCDEVWDYCVAEGLPFKYLLDRRIQYLCNSKYAPRGSSGKLITIYPRDEEELEKVLTGLGERVGGHEGPYILSDLRWEQGPLYVRYGAFADLQCLDIDGRPVPAMRRPDGVLVPDRRRPGFSVPPWVSPPEFLERQMRARGGSEEARPYRVDKALHFSNSGGVYLATRLSDGERVVLKEARPHTGVDGNGEDAIVRQEREKRALRRLDGIPGVPRLYDEFTMGGHGFLVQEYREGLPMYSWCAAHHPLVLRAHPSQEEIAEFTERMLKVLRTVEEIVRAIHDRGMVAGDLHLNNVLVGPDDQVTVIDFEQSFEVGEDWTPGLGAPGFMVAHREGRGIDEHSLALLRLTAFLAFAPISTMAPGKIRSYADLVERTFPVPRGWTRPSVEQLTAGGEGTDPARDIESPAELERLLAAGIRAAATPDREDRLFPGDIEQCVSGGYGFAHGAAGILWALDVCGHGRRPEYEEWFVSSVFRQRRLAPGFYDGVAGIAYTLDHLGYRKEAVELIDRHSDTPTGGLSLFSGLPGIGASLLHLSRDGGEPRFLDKALELADEIGDRVTGVRLPGSAGTGTELRAGLMRGWTGAALFYVRLYERTLDEGCLDLAVRALHRDLDQCTENDDGALLVSDRGIRGLPHIEGGGLGLALVAQEILAYREDGRLRESIPDLARSAHPVLTVRGDLMFGKGGQIAALARLGAEKSAVDDRVDELRSFLVPYKGGLALPSGRGFRLSMDLATGSAGLLLALATARGNGGPFLPLFRDLSIDTGVGGA